MLEMSAVDQPCARLRGLFNMAELLTKFIVVVLPVVRHLRQRAAQQGLFEAEGIEDAGAACLFIAREAPGLSSLTFARGSRLLDRQRNMLPPPALITKYRI
jgi:hypothetical protein